MKPNRAFQNLPPRFWANVRLISQETGYSHRKQSRVKAPTRDEIMAVFDKLGLSPPAPLLDGDGADLGRKLTGYLDYRARVLNEQVEPNLMDADKARKLFLRMKKQLSPQCPLPMNKQKGDKKAPAYMTGLVNMLIEANINGLPCDYDPRKLVAFSKEGLPVRTMARRVDGAFPSAMNPAAVWEIKEYYYTTTFGSRVADGIYETLLDGMELEELRKNENIDVAHCLIVDGHYTWWERGKSYLCRIVDMLHMGYVDEVLFGEEVVERLPLIARGWAERIKARDES